MLWWYCRSRGLRCCPQLTTLSSRYLWLLESHPDTSATPDIKIKSVSNRKQNHENELCACRFRQGGISSVKITQLKSTPQYLFTVNACDRLLPENNIILRHQLDHLRPNSKDFQRRYIYRQGGGGGRATNTKLGRLMFCTILTEHSTMKMLSSMRKRCQN